MFKLRIVLAVMLASMILALACAPAAAPPAPTAVPTQATKAAPSAVPTSTTPPKPTSVPTPKTLEKVTLAVPSTTTLFIPYYLARDKGYFAEEGLDVDITTIAAAISIKALASGSAQQFDAAGGSAQSAIIAGLPIRIVEILTKNPPWWIYSKPEIKSIADLKGKAIAVPSIGSALDITAGAVLKKHGLDPKSDVAWVATGPGAAWTGALKAGSVDAGVYSALGALDLKEAGFKELVDLGKEIPNVQGGLTTTEKLIKERPDLIKKMVTAMVKARKYYAAQSPAAREYYAKYANLDPTKAKQLYDLEALAETNNGLADDASLKFTVQFEQEQAGIKGDFPVENMYNMSFAKDANRELDAAGWKPQ